MSSIKTGTHFHLFRLSMYRSSPKGCLSHLWILLYPAATMVIARKLPIEMDHRRLTDLWHLPDAGQLCRYLVHTFFNSHGLCYDKTRKLNISPMGSIWFTLTLWPYEIFNVRDASLCQLAAGIFYFITASHFMQMYNFLVFFKSHIFFKFPFSIFISSQLGDWGTPQQEGIGGIVITQCTPIPCLLNQTHISLPFLHSSQPGRKRDDLKTCTKKSPAKVDRA